MRYRSRPTEVEAIQWVGGGSFDSPGGYSPCIANRPEHIVGWVNANGGEAYYDAPVPLGNRGVQPAAIAVRTINGWAFAAPGHYVVMGDATFHVGPLAGGVSHKRRDFYPCDPETFERRWEAAS